MSLSHLDFHECPEALSAVNALAKLETLAARISLSWYMKQGHETVRRSLPDPDEHPRLILYQLREHAREILKDPTIDPDKLFYESPRQIGNLAGAFVRDPMERICPWVQKLKEYETKPCSNEAFALAHSEFSGEVVGTSLLHAVWELNGVRDLFFTPLCAGILAGASEILSRANVPLHSDNALNRYVHMVRDAWLENQMRRIQTLPNMLRPTPGLAYRLLATDTKGVRGSDVVLPFPGFILLLPEKFISVTYPTSGQHWATHVKVAVETVLDGDLPETRMLCWRIEFMSGSRSTEHFDYPYSQASLLLSRDTVTLSDGDLFDPMGVTFRVGERKAKFFEVHEVIGKYIVNTLLYLNGSRSDMRLVNADELEKAKVRASKKNARKTDVERYKRLKSTSTLFTYGTHITVDPDIERSVRTGQRSGARWELKYKTVVRGHWRNQAHGPGRTLRSLKWIEPHTRGPDFSDKVAGHIYTVKG